METGLIKLLNLHGRTIYESAQAIFILKNLGFHDEEGKEISISDQLTVTQRLPGSFLLFIMTVHPYQADINCNQSRMDFRSCVQLLLDVDGIYAIIDDQMLNPPILFYYT